jgi:hypothetical protein
MVHWTSCDVHFLVVKTWRGVSCSQILEYELSPGQGVTTSQWSEVVTPYTKHYTQCRDHNNIKIKNVAVSYNIFTSRDDG